MAKLSKYFTPALEAHNRLALSKMLGLNQFVFRLNEVSGGQKLLMQNWSELGPQTLIDNPPLTDKAQPATTLSEVCVEHLTLFEEDSGLDNNSAFFSQILPYPYSLFFRSDTRNLKLTFTPESFLFKVMELRKVIGNFEQQLANFEISVLWIRGTETSLPLLFHFVRRRLVRVGTMSSLHDLTSNFVRGKLTPAFLREFFGTQSAFHELNITLFGDQGCPLDRLKASINRCLTQPTSRVLGDPVYGLESPPYLDLEL